MDSDPDPDIEFIQFVEKDSGMSSLGGSKDETPERHAVIVSVHLQENKIQPDKNLQTKYRYLF